MFDAQRGYEMSRAALVLSADVEPVTTGPVYEQYAALRQKGHAPAIARLMLLARMVSRTQVLEAMKGYGDVG